MDSTTAYWLLSSITQGLLALLGIIGAFSIFSIQYWIQQKMVPEINKVDIKEFLMAIAEEEKKTAEIKNIKKYVIRFVGFLYTVINPYYYISDIIVKKFVKNDVKKKSSKTRLSRFPYIPKWVKKENDFSIILFDEYKKRCLYFFISCSAVIFYSFVTMMKLPEIVDYQYFHIIIYVAVVGVVINLLLLILLINFYYNSIKFGRLWYVIHKYTE